MNTEDFQRKLTAIFSADVEGYSRLMGDDEDSTVKTLTAYRKVMSTLIKRYSGRVVDSPGDNLLAEFGSVRNAVRCAVEIQEELRIRNEDLPENRKMRYRIGINLGDVIEDGDRIYGDGINVAARVESLAEGGGISVSGTVYDSIRNKLSMSFESQGEHNVKNIKDPVRVYRIRMEPDITDEIVQDKVGLMRWQSAALTFVIFALVALGIWYYSFYKDPSVLDADKTSKTIAVIPFANISPDDDQEYFVDGLSEELLNSLAHIPGLDVAGRTSSFAFKDADKTAMEIANVLGVENILEGSVRKEGVSLRITAQLLRASDGFHLWSETFDRELKDIFNLQEDIAKAVADKLKVTLGIDSLKQLGGTENSGAYELYLNAKGQYKNFKKDHGLGFVDAAILLDREFALAYALKAQIQNHLSGFASDSQVPHMLEMSLKAAKKAVELEPKLAEAHFAVGIINTAKGKWIEAELAFQKALELITDPSSRHEIQSADHYMILGRFKKAKQILEEQLKVDPVNPRHHSNNIQLSLIHSDEEQALEHNKVAYGLLGDGWEDKKLISSRRLYYVENEDKKDDPPSNLKGFLGITDVFAEYLISEELAEIRKWLNEEDDRLTVSKLYEGSLYAAYSGDHEFAMGLIEKAGMQRADRLENLWYPVYREVRKSSRFKEFAKNMGLVDYWKKFGWPDLCRPIGDDDFECD